MSLIDGGLPLPPSFFLSSPPLEGCGIACRRGGGNNEKCLYAPHLPASPYSSVGGELCTLELVPLHRRGARRAGWGSNVKCLYDPPPPGFAVLLRGRRILHSGTGSPPLEMCPRDAVVRFLVIAGLTRNRVICCHSCRSY